MRARDCVIPYLSLLVIPTVGASLKDFYFYIYWRHESNWHSLPPFLLQYFVCLLIVFAAEIAAAVYAHVNLDKVRTVKSMKQEWLSIKCCLF